ncbi:MAG TPA: methyl-accepting chemotaxis protein [Candidatus Rifleibacterium sp.]|nr:methyl-accepting chemotaxis protein [Candidatus Rifleibacterium sp.]HPT45561.1 methyl-accepting chemotaxis protein [Candidatus Rifleibacterium sp.]
MNKHRRRTYLIKTGLQLRYMGIIISTMLLVAFGVGWVIYHTSWSRIANTPDLTLDKLSDIFDTVNGILMHWIVVFILAIAILSIFVSHKIAGPVYRLEETSKLIASGDLTQQIQLRQGDELRDLQEAFNQMSESLRKMVGKDREVIDKLVATTNRLRDKIDKKNLGSDSIEELTRDLHVVIEELRLVTSGFKIDDSGDDAEPDKPVAAAEV